VLQILETPRWRGSGATFQAAKFVPNKQREKSRETSQQQA
jgi:hypothetical protein